MSSIKMFLVGSLLLIGGCASFHQKSKENLPLLSNLKKDFQTPPLDKTFGDHLKNKFDLQMALKIAWKRNPAIQSARMKWRASLETILQANSYPDPVLTYTYYAKEVETKVGPQKQSFGIKQKIPFPGKLTLKGEMARFDVEMERLKTEKIIRNVLVQVKISYLELFYIQQAKKIYGKQKELLSRYVSFAVGEHGKNKVKFTETFKAQSFLAQMGYEEILLEEMELSEKQVLRSLLNLSTTCSLGNPKGISYSPLIKKLPFFIQVTEKNNEELRIVAQKVNKASSDLTLSKMGHLPDFTLGLKWVDTGSALSNTSDSGKDPILLSVGINVPLWWHKDAAKIDEKYYSLKGHKQSFQSLRQTLRSQVTKTYFQLTNAERLVRLYGEQLIPQSKQAMVTAEQRYREKVSNFATILETTSVWFNFQLAYWRALVDYNQYKSRMEKLTGRVLQ